MSRRALAAGDLERTQLKRSPKRASGGDGVVGGGPGARLLGSPKAIRRTLNGRTSRCLQYLVGSLGEACRAAHDVPHVAEAEVSTWMKQGEQRSRPRPAGSLLVDELSREGYPLLPATGTRVSALNRAGVRRLGESADETGWRSNTQLGEVSGRQPGSSTRTHRISEVCCWLWRQPNFTEPLIGVVVCVVACGACLVRALGRG